MTYIYLLVFYLSSLSGAAQSSYNIPPTAPIGSAELAPAPVGVSFEFKGFPLHFTDLAPITNQCLKNLATLTGTWPPIRIGGNSQDRAAYNASSKSYIEPSVPLPSGVAAKLQFGPSFMTLAGTYSGTVVLGLNRGLNNLENTIEAAKVAKGQMKNLLAIELGNEPDLYVEGQQPIAQANGGWDPTVDAESEDEWGISVGTAVLTENIIQAGNFAFEASIWGAVELIKAENDTAKSYVNGYSHHNYPGNTNEGDPSALMSHSNIVLDVAAHKTSSEAARAVGKYYVFGETNSVAGGGSSIISPTFGAALWILDYILQATLLNISRSYFHQSPPGGPCYYCWWTSVDMRNPYYGAYVATATMAGGSYITALDTGEDDDAVYIIYDSSSKPLRALLYNSQYYSGQAQRDVKTFTLTGLTAQEVKSKRLTAPSATSMRSQGEIPTFGNQQFEDGTCIISGTETFEPTTVSNGQAEFQVGASEALLIYL